MNRRQSSLEARIEKLKQAIVRLGDLRPGKLSFSFNPEGQISLGKEGTVMTSLAWRSDDGGALEAPEGALVSPDWTELRLPLPRGLRPGTLAEARSYDGEGYELRLPAGWVIERAGRGLVAHPPPK